MIPVHKSLALVLPLCLALAACARPPQGLKQPPQAAAEARYPEGMVAAANPLAVDAGAFVLDRGGSAMDAAVATMAVLGLVEPQSAGVGGGGFLIHYEAATERLAGYDGRETAPAAAGPDLFLEPDGKPTPYAQAVASGRSVGAPGLFAMLQQAHAKHGRLPWAVLFQPAIDLAEKGFVISPRLHNSVSGMLRRGAFAGPAGASASAYLLTPEGAPKPAGAVLRNPEYAAVMRAIAARGGRAVLEGPIAEAIVAAVGAQPRPGGLSLADLAAYQPREMQPLCGPFRLLLVCSLPPPASGGVTLPEILGLYARARPEPAGPGSVEDWAAFLWASRIGYVDRDFYVADPAFAAQPGAAMFAPAYLDARAAEIDLARAAPERLAPGDLGPLRQTWGLAGETPENGTTHLSIVDARGDAVALTATIEAPFGAQRMAMGFFLNNQLTDFSFQPLLNGKQVANAAGPGKRPRSSMSPAILLEADGDLYGVIGSPGGSSIPAYVAKAIIGVVDWDLGVQEAVSLPNVVARGSAIRVESALFAPEIAAALKARGWDIRESAGENSGLHGIVVRGGTLEGGADPRREGVARSGGATAARGF